MKKLLILNLLLILPQISLATVCNEALCASIVSKCTLLKSCECEIEPTGCSCCKKCYACLEYLQAECCSCVGLCPVNNSTLQNPKSVVGDIQNPTEQVWEALMIEEDPHQRWITQKYVQESSNCTIAALSTEMGDTKCKNDCKSMGATSYRWFNDGCCHCVGHGCVNYGTNTASCGFSTSITNYDELSDSDLQELETEYESVLSTKSIVDDITQSSPTLWNALTEGEDMYQPWKTLTYPVDVPTDRPTHIQETIQEDIQTLNCTVAFWQSEMADMKCEKSCVSMGAASYRWFNDGCCECIGHNCINYGLNEARCGFSIENSGISETSELLDYETLTDQELETLYLAEYGGVDSEENSENTESSNEE